MADKKPKDRPETIVLGPFNASDLAGGLAGSLAAALRDLAGKDPEQAGNLEGVLHSLETRQIHADAEALSRRLHNYIKHVETSQPPEAVWALLSCAANLVARYFIPREEGSQAAVDELLLKSLTDRLGHARAAAAKSPVFLAESVEAKRAGLPIQPWMEAPVAEFEAKAAHGDKA